MEMSSSWAENNAALALSSYLRQGPAKPHSDMSVNGLEWMRSKLTVSRYAAHHEAAGWVGVDQALAVHMQPHMQTAYSPDNLIVAAEDHFTQSLDRYDVNEDLPSHLWRVDLAMFSLPVYQAWMRRELSGSVLLEFHNEVVALAEKLLTIREEESGQWDVATQKDMIGFAAEVAFILAYNRRHKSVGADQFSVAIPSTYRQNNSRQPGKSGSPYDKTRLRGNWDVSIISRRAGELVLGDRVQVKSILGRSSDVVRQQDYASDISVVSIFDHVCRDVFNGRNAQWDALCALLVAEESGSTSAKATAIALSKNAYERLRECRQQQNNDNSDIKL